MSESASAEIDNNNSIKINSIQNSINNNNTINNNNYDNNNKNNNNNHNDNNEMKSSKNENEYHAATEEGAEVVREIPAAQVRSGLAQLEQKASEALQRLENVKNVTPPSSSAAAAAAAQFTAGDTAVQSSSVDNDNFMYGQKQQQQQILSSFSSGFLPSDSKQPNEIFDFLEMLISQSDSDDEAEYPLPSLDEVSHLALISHSIVAYMSHLDYSRLSSITSKICTDTNRWLAHIFRFIDATASYHTDMTEAILRAVRLAIVTRCPGYLEGGVPALANPCLYISENSSPLGLQYACRQLGLPMQCIRLVAANQTFGTIDISILQKLIATDIASNRTPLFVVADAGSSICGYVDNLIRLQDVCRHNSIWLHCRGHSLAAIAVQQGSSDLNPIADSMSLDLGNWLGLPNLPVTLLHRPIQNVALSVFESDPVLSRRLSSLSLWTTLQALGRDVISKKLISAFESCRILYEIISHFDGVRILSKRPGGENGASIMDLINKPLNIPLLFETAIAVVLFQFDGNFNEQLNHQNASNDQQQQQQQSIINASIEKVSNSVYFNKLNMWLGQVLQKKCPSMDFEIVDHNLYGTCIRFCPLELNLGDKIPTLEQLENAAERIETQIDILIATVRHKVTLNRLIAKSDVLRLVHLQDWAGLGGVRFVPEGWETLLTDQAKTELNKLNADIVECIRENDTAFSIGEGDDGLICVRFGMVTHDTDIQELLNLIISVGRVQENARVLDTMAEIVKKGIETATADLQRESDEKLWSEGILRHVPVFGQVVNWWSPPVKESGIKGRSLNLQQGIVESTENIYKYHMQLPAGVTQIHGSKSPPTPMVQTSVSAGHSRNVSQSSGTSTTTTTTTNQDNKNNSNVGTGPGAV